ncbi:hypothetical protein K2Y11_09420 [bacterium]|nr:hypothetical protein [bacterium]
MRTGYNNLSARRGGFTLVELLVSVALTVFMLTLFATLFAAGNDAVRVARGTSEIDRSVQGAITKIRRDLEFVYVGDNVSLGKAFSAADQIPSAGYFTIEENMPASPPYYLSDANAASKITDPTLKTFVQAIQARITAFTPLPPGYTGAASPTTMYRQGVDERGLPVEVDVDDVIAFTVKLTGNSPENIMYGKVPIGSILDSDLDPGSRFDQPDNGIFTSPYAEVAYFLRPNRPYSVAEISRPALGSDDGRIQTPATYTLYRRELLLLSPQQRNQVEKRLTTGGYGTLAATGGGRTASALNDLLRAATLYPDLNPSLNSSNLAYYNPSYYHNYDVSAYYGYDSTRDPIASGNRDFGNLSYYSFRFNDPVTVRLRQNRYGMQWLFPPIPAATLPPAGSPLLLSPDSAVPGYDHPQIASGAARMYVPGPTPSGKPLAWHGRPTLFESTMIGNNWTGPTTAPYDSAYSPLISSGHPSSLDLNNTNFINPPAPPSSARRNDADVLLTNVLSFDVKVLNDDIVQGLYAPTPPVPPGGSIAADVNTLTGLLTASPDPMNWPGDRTSTLAPFDTTYDIFGKVIGASTFYRPGILVGNPSRPWSDPSLGAPLSPAIVQPDFLDLGYMLATEFFANPSVGFPRCFQDLSFVSIPSGSVFPPSSASIPRYVPWGLQTPARWASTGRREASYAFYDPGNYQPLRSVYDTWAPEYRPEFFANNFVTPPNPVSNAFLPPYDRPVRGVQITIRIWEPRTGLTREFQIVHRFK